MAYPKKLVGTWAPSRTDTLVDDVIVAVVDDMLWLHHADDDPYSNETDPVIILNGEELAEAVRHFLRHTCPEEATAFWKELTGV